jgi:outer membrane protein TolC
MKKIMLLALLAVAWTLPAKVTLSQAVANAWRISPGLDSQILEEKAAAIARVTAQRQKYFSVLFSGGFRYSSDKVQVKASDFPFSLGPAVDPGTVILSAPGETVDLKMSLLQPLYSGGLLSNAVKMEAIRSASERDLTRLKRIELANKVKSSFFTHLLFSNKLDSLNSFLSSLELHLQKVTHLYDEGLARRSDLLETQAKADEVRLQLQDLEQLRSAEAVQFHSLSGYDPQDVAFTPAAKDGSFDAARDRFLAGHPLLHSLDEKGRLIRIRKRSVSAAYLPQVSAFAEAHYGRPGQNFFMDQWTLYFQGGVSVSMPVFNWNKGGRDKELLDVAARQLENQRADFVRESEKGLRQLFLYKHSLKKKQALLEGLLANAAEDIALK